MFALYSLFYPLFVSLSFAHAFSFTAGTLSECDDLQVQWSGGTGPYQLLIIPSFGTPRNFSIPSSAYVDGTGSFSTTMNLPAGQRLVLTMSDSTGFATGGTTDVLTVGPSEGGTACDTKNPGIAFPFELNLALQQCRPFVFSGYSQAAQPVTIRIVIPGGTSLLLTPPLGSQSFSWMANAAQGTSMMFMMTDANGGQGGSSDVKLVGASDDNSCLSDLSPSSTSSAPSSTTITSKTAQSPNSSGTAPPASTTTATAGVPISAIAGTVIGALLFLAVIVTLGLFILRRRRDSAAVSDTSLQRHSRRLQSDGDFFDSSRPPNAHPYELSPPAGGPPYNPHSPNSTLPFENPFLDSASSNPQFPSNYQQISAQYQHDPFRAQVPYYPPSPPNPALDPFNSSGPPILPGATFEPLSMNTTEQTVSQDSTSTSQRKAAIAGVSVYKPSRFIVHTDVEDELPPQYSERRGPLNIVNPSPPSPNSARHPSEYPFRHTPLNVSPFS